MAETKIITSKVRFSYVHVFEPHAVTKGEAEKYSMAILIPKSDTKLVEEINAAIQQAAENGKTAKFGGKVPRNLKLPMRDGDVEREDDEAYVGMYFINANSNRKPGVVDKKIKPVLDPEEVYSGCYGRVSIDFYPYDSNGNKGVACGLLNVMKLEDGEKLSGGATAQEDFEGLDDDMMA